MALQLRALGAPELITIAENRDEEALNVSVLFTSLFVRSPSLSTDQLILSLVILLLLTYI